jgi:APA family basic amino acid/polyamine antiporter
MPLVFVISGLIFAATAATYAEGTVLYPEAGGSASFARHAFNELVSFAAGWAQMLNYIITVAISAFFVPHYLSIFWEPLRTNPWDIIGGIVVIVLLVLLNIVGIREAASLNIFLALVDFATQLLLVILGFVLILSPHTLTSNIHWGVAPTWANFALAIPVAMIAYTGIETVSNLAEEARDPVRSIPDAIRWVAVAVFAIYFTLPLVALSALPVYKDAAGDYVTKLGLPPDKGGFENDPVLGLVENLGLHGAVLSAAKVYVGVLAATILFIATNAGVIGASRITYSMSTYRQLPEMFRRLHPKLRTPWLSLTVFAGVLPIVFVISGKVGFLGRMYAFGAMLSFTIAHASVIALRVKKPDRELPWRARPNLRIGRISWPVFAVLGGLGTGIAWFVVVWKDAPTRYAGLAWLGVGFVFYPLYRRHLHEPLLATVRAPVVLTAAALEYRNILVPLARGRETDEALDVACRLATDRGARVVAIAVVEVSLDLPLDASMHDAEQEAHELLDRARTLGDSYGVGVIGRLARDRRAGRAIVREASQRNSEIVVMGSPRRRQARAPVFGDTTDYVLKHAPCRVMVVGARAAA